MNEPQIPADLGATYQVAALRIGDVAIALASKIEQLPIADLDQANKAADALNTVAGALAGMLDVGRNDDD